jgi:hypothetical protein
MHFARGRMVAFAAGWAAMRRFGCRAGTFFEDNCAYDNRRLNELARKYGRDAKAADQLVAWARREADRIINERWSDIEYLAGVLSVFGDEMDEESLQTFLRRIPRDGASEPLRHRRCFISSDWQRRGLSKPRGYDVETREIDAVLSTGAAVKRRDWDGEFLEVLDMSPKSVRLARINQGAAVLDSHAWDKGLSAMLGGIVPGSARVANGELTARIKFSRGSELAQRITKDLADGIQIPLSVGYKVHKTVDDRSTNPITHRAVDWEPLEVSLVPVAAEESGTGFRQQVAA